MGISILKNKSKMIFLNNNFQLKSKGYLFDKTINSRKLQRSGNIRLDLVFSLILIADNKICKDITILNVYKNLKWTSFFLILTVPNRSQLSTVFLEMTEFLKKCEEKFKANLSESEWELLDLGDIIINIITKDKRKFYDLETIHKNAEEIFIEDYLFI